MLCIFFGIPKILFFRKSFYVLFSAHTAAGEVVNRDACGARHKLPPGIVKNIIVMMSAVLVKCFKLTGGETVSDTTDGAKNAAEAPIGNEVVEWLFFFTGKAFDVGINIQY